MEEWLPPLQQGQTEVAWDRFLSRYRRLIFASIRHYTQDYDDGMDLFAHVCEQLRADGMRRLRARAEDPTPRARLSSWLVAVVRHLVADWFRHRDGRRRLSAVARDLAPLRRRIFELVFVERRSHGECYEMLRSAEEPGLGYREFLAELRETYRSASGGRRGQLMRLLGPPPPLTPEEDDPPSPVETAERTDRLRRALGTLPEADRLAVELYLIEDLPADQVAGILGLPNAKAVYNRVYRALAALRVCLEQAGIRAGDL